MADESDLERTEPASPRRLEQAREDGQVARSHELSTFMVLGAGCLALWLLGGQLLAGFKRLTARGFEFDHAAALLSDAMLMRLSESGGSALFILLPVLGVVLAAALVSPTLLNGWLFSAKPVQPDFSRLNPLNGLGRIFSMNGAMELAKAVAKALVVALVAVAAVWQQRDTLLALGAEPVAAGPVHAAQLIGWIALMVVGGLGLIAAVDVPFQVWQHHRKLRMTRDEQRREAKESEGDPHVKARIRSLQREAARKRMMAEVPKADVVVVNPTRYAVALSYRENTMRAPRVVAKGQHLLAARIREIAEENGVPLLEAPPLARALYRHAEIGQEIPEALYTAVAEVLAYVFQLRRSGRQVAAPPPRAIPVPAGMDPEEVRA